MIGVSPDLPIAVRRDILAEIDAPMLRYGAQDLAGGRLEVPRERASRPDREGLEVRHRHFLDAAWPVSDRPSVLHQAGALTRCTIASATASGSTSGSQCPASRSTNRYGADTYLPVRSAAVRFSAKSWRPQT